MFITINAPINGISVDISAGCLLGVDGQIAISKSYQPVVVGLWAWVFYWVDSLLYSTLFALLFSAIIWYYFFGVCFFSQGILPKSQTPLLFSFILFFIFWRLLKKLLSLIIFSLFLARINFDLFFDAHFNIEHLCKNSHHKVNLNTFSSTTISTSYLGNGSFLSMMGLLKCTL